MKGEKNNLTKQLQSLMERLKDQGRNEANIRTDLDSYRRELETERRKSSELGNLHKKYQQDFQQNLNN